MLKCVVSMIWSVVGSEHTLWRLYRYLAIGSGVYQRPMQAQDTHTCQDFFLTGSGENLVSFLVRKSYLK